LKKLCPESLSREEEDDQEAVVIWKAEESFMEWMGGHPD
jgi:hypothetical protein